MSLKELNSIRDLHNRKLVELVYQTMLERKPDLEGLVHHSNVLKVTKSVESIVKNVEESREYANKRALFVQSPQVTQFDKMPGLGTQAKRIYLALQTEILKRREDR